MAEKKKKEIVKAVCWLCKHPYEFDVGKDLSPWSLSSILRGVRRVRYLQYCKICCKKSVAEIYSAKTEGSWAWREGLGVRERAEWEINNAPTVILPEENPVRNWSMLKKKHMYLMGGRCQICDRRVSSVEVYKKSKRRPDRTPLQRDTVALCSECYDCVEHRLAMAEN
jgi:hypothetical protein